jgi:Holliday junction DNA helicase RuvB
MAEQRATDVHAASPSVLDKVIGQRAVVEQVRVGLAAAWADGSKFDHALLVGPPGLGKSMLASVISKELASDLHEVLGQSVATPADLNALLFAAKDRDVVFIDEVHELRPEFQTALYRAAEERKLFVPRGGTSGGAQPFPLADFTLLLATTDEYRLLQPLRDRMKMVLRMAYYEPPELQAVVAQRAAALGWEVEQPAVSEIGSRGRGTPRLALRLLEASRRVCRAGGEQVITAAHVLRACGLEQLDSLGLDTLEQQYLRILAGAAGAVRLNVIATRLGLPPATVSKVVEPFLIRSGLVAKDDGGRELTARGRDHLGRNEGAVLGGRPA